MNIRIELKVALEKGHDFDIGDFNAGDVISSNEQRLVYNREGLIFACGADEVWYIDKRYLKTFDRGQFDRGRPVRTLVYEADGERK